ncbi:hypothetical protein R1flu_022628 [Riccia fluitans]|uniref:Amine oxidase domain-containing protein n=1 Tax=Riccia fluitans TaxID=41844 RepID=A0ABD1XSM5_9MARC
MANACACLVVFLVLAATSWRRAGASETVITDVIIIGAGAAGLSAGKTLSERGVVNFVILEATEKIGGRVRNANFGGVKVELGANWIEGVNGEKENPVYTLANEVNLKYSYAFYDNYSQNIYDHTGYLAPEVVAPAVERADESFDYVEALGTNFTNENLDDISVLTAQRFFGRVPSSPVEMAIDSWKYDFSSAEPPRVTSLRNSEPLPTDSILGPDSYFVSDQRGYATVLHPLAYYLRCDEGVCNDPRLKLSTVVTKITYSTEGVTVHTEDDITYNGKAAILTVSIGVLQSDLINFSPDLPFWKLSAIYQFNMAVYTKIFLKFPKRFWPIGPGTEYILYADEKRGYYPFWQHLEQEFPGENIIFTTVTDDESRRIEQMPDNETLAEVMLVLRKMFGPDIPNATDILYPRWWQDKYFRGTFSNWPIGVSSYEYKQLQAPVGRLYFSGEHCSEQYNGYVHGAIFAGNETAHEVLKCLYENDCNTFIPSRLKPSKEMCEE